MHNTLTVCLKTPYRPPVTRAVCLSSEVSVLMSNTETIEEQEGDIEWD